MNSIQAKQRIDFYLNLTAAARFTFAEYNLAMNDAVNEFINQQFGDEENRDPKSFEMNQQIRDNLFTLIKVATPSVSDGTTVTTEYYSSTPSSFTYPTDYDMFISLRTIIGGVSSYARPTTYNQIGPLLQDSFKHPTNNRPYVIETSTGFTVWRGTTGTLTVSLTYLKLPTAFSIGSETQLISDTTTVLTNLATYYATEVTVFNGVTYQIGATLTGNGVNALTSGQVILASQTSPIDLPEKTQERLCKACAAKMLKSIGMLQESLAMEAEAAKM
nr:hypothetical protein [uncultured Flavobacterium sp.]